MKPPICSICGKGFGMEEGGLIYFVQRPSDIEWRERMNKTGGKGHPPWAAWFCGEHYEKAKLLSNLTIDKAFQKIK